LNPKKDGEATRGRPAWWVPLIVIVLLVSLYRGVSNANTAPAEQVPLNTIARLAQEGDLRRVVVQGDNLTIVKNDGTRLQSRKESGVSVVETLRSLGVSADRVSAVEVVVEGEAMALTVAALLLTLLPTLLLVGFFILIFRSARNSSNGPLGFAQSRAKLLQPAERPTVTFGDVAGADSAKEELQEVVHFLKDPARFSRLGAKIPRGVLMVGSPGTGKTLLARAVAGEAGVPFFLISGSEFVEMFVGVGASRVRDLFKRARETAPCIVFVDEIDAVGRSRGIGLGGGNDEREQTLNQMLVEMDGFSGDSGVIIIAATNRPDVLDPALLRPGRFDRRITVDLPDVAGREAILRLHASGKPFHENASLAALAQQTPGFAGADLANLVNEAALLAARRGVDSIEMRDCQDALERIIAGPERRTLVLTPREREVVAYHEAGHAVVMALQAGGLPVQKISIVSRGRALGYTIPLPEGDQVLRTKEQFEAELAGLLGGRAAEDLIYGSITTGASNDLERATKIARTMVTRYGMSEEVGMVHLDHEPVFGYGRDPWDRHTYSERVSQLIDGEVRRIIDDSYRRAKATLTTHVDKLRSVAQALLKQETLDRSEFEALLA
jgi:cell division protease FtsH